MPKPAAKEATPTAKSKFRGLTLGAHSTRRSETITIDIEGEKIPVVLRTPSLSGQETAQEACGMEFIPTGGTDAKGNPEFKSIIKKPLRYAIEMVILCCFEPVYGPNNEVTGPGEPMFDQVDREAFLDEAMSGWLKELSDKVSDFNKTKPAAAAKNSEATPSATSVSP